MIKRLDRFQITSFMQIRWNTFSIMFMVLLGFVANSCIDELEFERPDTLENSIAIQGKLVKGDPSVVTVTVRKVFDFASEPRLINARRIALLNEKGDEILLESDDAGGFRAEIPAGDPQFPVEYGDAFRLEVDLFDGRTYESEFDELYPVSNLDSVKARITLQERVGATGNLFQEEVIGFFLDADLFTSEQQRPRLLWELEGTYRLTDSPTVYGTRPCRPDGIDNTDKTCYLTISPQVNHIPLDANELSEDRLEDFLLFEASISYIFAEGYYLSVFQQSLSPQAFDYWEQVSQVVNQSGGIFEAPSGKIISNFRSTSNPEEDVFGFFYATEQSTQRVYVSPDLAQNPPTRCPAPLSQGGTAPGDCCNCANVPGSSTQRPEWWVE